MDAPKQPTSRLESVDLLKGLIMMLIVYLHMLFMVPAQDNDGSVALPFQIGYLGLMIFFLFSGYFYRPGRTAAQNIWRRCKQLIPAVVLSAIIPALILFVYLTALGQAPGWEDLKVAFGTLSGSMHTFESVGVDDVHYWGTVSNFSGQYFLQLMLASFVLFYIITEHLGNDVRKTIAVIIVMVLLQVVLNEAVGIILPFCLYLVPITTAFMFLGELLARDDYMRWMESRPVKEMRYWAMILISVAVMVGVCILFPPGIRFPVAYFGGYGGWSAIPFFIEACATMHVIIFLGTWLLKLKLPSKVLSTIGKHTLAIICFHPLIIKFLIAPFHRLSCYSLFPALSIAEVAVVGTVTLVILTLTTEYLFPKVINRLSKKNTAA